MPPNLDVEFNAVYRTYFKDDGTTLHGEAVAMALIKMKENIKHIEDLVQNIKNERIHIIFFGVCVGVFIC